jgi:glycerophosphoryl diester phosphodiesterase
MKKRTSLPCLLGTRPTRSPFWGAAMLVLKRLLLVVLVLLSSTCVSVDTDQAHYVSFEHPTELHEYLRWYPDRTPLLAAHRGGPSPGFPENCIATFEHSLSFTPCIIECDVRKSKDSILVLIHDWNLDRTTTGSGSVDSLTLTQLKQLNLVDANGTVTEYRIPTLAEAIRWAKGRTILELDTKGGVTPHEVVEAIKAEDAESHVIVITYNLPAAELYYGLAENLVMSCSARSPEGVARLLESGIPSENIIAWVGMYEPPVEVYEMLHEKEICAILGTMGNLDRKARISGTRVYLELLRNGADILATDDVELASEVITRRLQDRVESR